MVVFPTEILPQQTSQAQLIIPSNAKLSSIETYIL